MECFSCEKAVSDSALACNLMEVEVTSTYILPSSHTVYLIVPYCIISVGTDLFHNSTKKALNKRFFVTFEPDEEVKKLEIFVLDDDIVEATENHIIKLRVPDGETRVNLLQDQANVTVVDNDGE